MVEITVIVVFVGAAWALIKINKEFKKGDRNTSARTSDERSES